MFNVDELYNTNTLRSTVINGITVTLKQRWAKDTDESNCVYMLSRSDEQQYSICYMPGEAHAHYDSVCAYLAQR